MRSTARTTVCLLSSLSALCGFAGCAATRDDAGANRSNNARASVRAGGLPGGALSAGGSDALALDAEAERALAALRSRRLPAALDSLVERLLAASRAEGSTRGRALSHRAGALLAARFDVTRDPSDARRASGLLEALIATGGARDPRGCETRARLGALYEAAGDRERARGTYGAYERACPEGADRPAVRAALERMDPASAQADREAAPSRQQRVARVAERGSLAALFPSVPQPRYRRIVIDPGHGGSDPGARGPTGLTEASVTLDVARRVADQLAERTGAQVLLTRDADEYVPLETRAARANEAHAELFLSIHCNSSPNPVSRGVSTYVLDTQGEVIAARLARREEGELISDPRAGPEVFRVLAGLRLDGLGQRSQSLAEGIQRSLLRALRGRYEGVDDLGVHAARFAVLVGARMPAVLVELSFVSNPLEESRLREPAYRDVLATAVARAVANARE